MVAAHEHSRRRREQWPRRLEEIGGPGIVAVAPWTAGATGLAGIARALAVMVIANMNHQVRLGRSRQARDGGKWPRRAVAARLELAVAELQAAAVRTTDQKGNVVDVVLEICYRRIKVLPPIGKQSRYPALSLTIIHARERAAPANRKPIECKLITDLPVASRREAIEKLDWYAMRWKIETFHKILKSGCRAEESRLRTADRLANLISIFCIISWRIFWLTMINRTCPDAEPALALTKVEIELLNCLVKDSKKTRNAPPLSRYLEKIAQLGGYLARANDSPPGNIAMWRGMRRLADMQFGFNLASERYG